MFLVNATQRWYHPIPDIRRRFKESRHRAKRTSLVERRRSTTAIWPYWMPAEDVEMPSNPIGCCFEYHIGLLLPSTFMLSGARMLWRTQCDMHVVTS
ncbi:hypothetical protein BJX96DRAFT_153889 [Aspergillus floccosus]